MDHDTTRGQLASADRFFDTHPEIAEQLRKDPSLVNNKEFVKNHPDLATRQCGSILRHPPRDC